MRGSGKSKREATSFLSGQSIAFKKEILFERGINYNDVPMWQKRGIGIYGDTVVKEGFNPLTKEAVQVKRNTFKINYELPLSEDYAAFIGDRVNLKK